MKTFLSVKLHVLFVITTIAPWLIWLDMNAMALRFLVLKDHWPTNKDMDSISNDALYRFLDPTIGGESGLFLFMTSAFASIPV